jgi:hypothetical protein
MGKEAHRFLAWKVARNVGIKDSTTLFLKGLAAAHGSSF